MAANIVDMSSAELTVPAALDKSKRDTRQASVADR